uniref:NR LBD domain-containing protein n=1 Tax=Panagrellus redivivus TaxID=6233 RepID=A0A7E4ZPR8_PANRE
MTVSKSDIVFTPFAPEDDKEALFKVALAKLVNVNFTDTTYDSDDHVILQPVTLNLCNCKFSKDFFKILLYQMDCSMVYTMIIHNQSHGTFLNFADMLSVCPAITSLKVKNVLQQTWLTDIKKFQRQKLYCFNVGGTAEQLGDWNIHELVAFLVAQHLRFQLVVNADQTSDAYVAKMIYTFGQKLLPCNGYVHRQQIRIFYRNQSYWFYLPPDNELMVTVTAFQTNFGRLHSMFDGHNLDMLIGKVVEFVKQALASVKVISESDCYKITVNRLAVLLVIISSYCCAIHPDLSGTPAFNILPGMHDEINAMMGRLDFKNITEETMAIVTALAFTAETPGCSPESREAIVTYRDALSLYLFRDLNDVENLKMVGFLKFIHVF